MPEQKDVYTLFTEYLRIANQAIEKHADSFPFRELIAGGEKLFGGRHIGAAVYADDPDEPFDYFTLRLTNHKFELLARGKQDPDITWKISRAYLDKVVSDPETYVEHPFKLDWEWLKSRLPKALAERLP